MHNRSLYVKDLCQREQMLCAEKFNYKNIRHSQNRKKIFFWFLFQTFESTISSACYPGLVTCTTQLQIRMEMEVQLHFEQVDQTLKAFTINDHF